MDENYYRIYKAWEKFVKFGKLSEDVLRPSIAKSWKRCAEYGLDPYLLRVVHPIKDAGVLKKENKELIAVCRPFMELVYNIVRGSGFIVILVDSRGYVLELLGDREAVEAAEANYLIPGANRNEENTGTNAIALALSEKKPVQIFGPEHYNYYFHTWTCSAAPIKDSYGRIIGVFNMSGHYSLVHKHTLGIVGSTVRAIERELSLKEAHNEVLFIKDYLEAVINSVNEGLLAFDKEGNIMHANFHVAEMLGTSREGLINRNLRYVVEPSAPFLQMLESGRGCVDKEYYLKKGSTKTYCLITSRPIVDQQNEVRGFVSVLREKQRVHNLVHRMVGATANFTFDDIIGESRAIKDCIELARKVAPSNSKVLLEGESGTGKELFAQAVHNFSDRKKGPFIAVNCSAIPRELIESEFFGYEEGAFTGARKRGKPGKFELAEGGTIFLDEVSSMPLDMQVKLLRVLQENCLVRVGGINVIPLDVRIIAATNQNLAQLVEKGSFREDLYYRLNVVTIKVPPLRERKEDINIIVNYFAQKLSARAGLEEVRFTDEVLELLALYEWPGNIRELENVVERAVILSKSSVIDKELLPDEIKALQPGEAKTGIPGVGLPGGEAAGFGDGDSGAIGAASLEAVEMQAIREALNKTGGNVSRAAKILGVSRNTIYNKMKKYG